MEHHLEEHKWTLLAKYHSGECSKEECEQLGDLLKNQPESQHDLEQTATIWQAIQEPKVNTGNAWEKLQQKMNLPKEIQNPETTSSTIVTEKNWELLAKYHSGEISKAESNELEKLLESQPKIQEEFEQSATIWQAIQKPKVNTESAWEKMQQKMNPLKKVETASSEIVTERKWELVAKHHSGEISEAENIELGELLKFQSKAQTEFDESATIWEAVQKPTLNTENAWKNIATQLFAKETKIRKLHPPKAAIVTTWKSNNLYKIAASISLLVLSLWAGFTYFTTPITEGEFVAMVSTSTSTQQKQVITLADGTKVFLNENSTLSYPEVFAGKNRQVILEGEAFFDVTRNEEKPFIITTKDATVKVLGTSFKVNTHSKEEVEVVVKTGKVALKSNTFEKGKIILEAGFKGTVSKKNEKVSKVENTNPNYLAWQTGKMIFDETEMHEVVNVLNSVYDIEIEFAENASINCNYTATFEQQPVDDIIDVIGKTLSLDIQKENGKIVIYGNCE